MRRTNQQAGPVVRYARLAPGRGFSPLRACAHAIERLALHPTLRYLVEETSSRAVSLFHPAPPATPDPCFGQQITRLRETGLLRLGPMLTRAQLADINDSLLGAPMFDAADRTRALDTARAEAAAIMGYPLAVVLDCPHLLELANEPRLLALVGAYLGCKPTIITWGLLRSRPARGPAWITQRFHRDHDAWRSVKLFVYLSDVDEGAGPHVYACGTHRTRSSLRAKSYSDAEAAAQARMHGLDIVTGEAGSGFLADTFGLHKGQSPTLGERLILQIHYASLPSPLYLYDPLQPSRAVPDIDAYVNRLFVAAAEPAEAAPDELAEVGQPAKEDGVTVEP